jgi:hypothetical protein
MPLSSGELRKKVGLLSSSSAGLQKGVRLIPISSA